jgi:hypothetical protein
LENVYRRQSDSYTIQRKQWHKTFSAMDNSDFKPTLYDNGGRRSGIDRRSFSYSDHIPERRRGSERRMLEERRLIKDRRKALGKIAGRDRRIGCDRRAYGPKTTAQISRF